MGMHASADIHFGWVGQEPETYDCPWIGLSEEEQEELEIDTIEGWLDYLANDTTKPIWDAYTYERLPYKTGQTYEERQAHEEQWEKDNPEWREMYDAQRERSKARMADCPIDFDHVGYIDGYSTIVLYLKGFHVGIYEYGPEEFVLPESPSQEVIDKAREFCEANKIKWEEPKWLISASYG